MNVPNDHTAVLSKLECYPSSVTELYKEASQLFSSGKFSEAADKIEAALKELDDCQEEDKQTWGFAELQLLYGRSLLEIIKCSSSSNDDIFGPKVPKIVGLPTDSEEAEEEEDPSETEEGLPKELNHKSTVADVEESKHEENVLVVYSREDSPVEKDTSSDSGLPEQQLTEMADSEESRQGEEEEQDIRELAWEQLECARVILASQLPDSKLRLAVVYEALGDFGMENDNNEQAAQDFKSAVKCYEEAGYSSSRMVGGLYHSIYLALRSVEPDEARKNLKLAADVFKKRIAENKEKVEGQTNDVSEVLDDEEEILKEIELEIADFECVISNQEKENSTCQHDKEIHITRVEPRKRAEANTDVTQEQKTALCETFSEQAHELVANKRSRTCTEKESLSTEH
ncbi:hypothetical protein GpartN1_g7587.t1 [Galdieria partita]|uniref:Tetratricopeptide SHNi-TPR domain-containing protein n=1 Tax=Galdieria partita TaxID=83374 RepID=A0A9C7Q6L7_9RHOD|nr:hypothetical protein GpartN1_g7587.t1 [Galdieria partita]